MLLVRCPTGERRSKRARRGRAPLRVSSSDVLGNLKLRVLEALGTNPQNAAVYVRGRLLQDDSASLAGRMSHNLLMKSD